MSPSTRALSSMRGTLARAYDDTLSLKLLDYDNIGFTKKGKKVGYEQFIALAFKQ